MKNQMRAASVLHVQAGENRLSVEVTPDAVYFERETGSVFRIGEGGRYTVVFGEEFEVFHDLNKPFFGLTHTENGATVERLRLERDCFLEMFVDSVFPVAGQALALIPLDHFAQIYPEVRSGQAGTPPWAEGAEGKPEHNPSVDTTNDYIVMKDAPDRMIGNRHGIERHHIEMAERLRAEYITIKELCPDDEPLFFRFKTQDLLEKMGDSLCVLAELNGHEVG